MPFQPILQSDLEALVEDQLEQYVQNHDEFTAYDVTLALRENNPDTEILNVRVRPIVHDSMWRRIQNGLTYAAEDRDYNGTAALTYYFDDQVTTLPDAATITTPTGQQVTIDLSQWNSLFPTQQSQN